MQTNTTTQQQTQTPDANWLTEELKDTQLQNTNFGERLPAMKFEENKIAELVIDFSKPFQSYNADNNGKIVVKKIIPIMHDTQKKNWWLSTKNPVYRELLLLGASGVNHVKVLQTGNQATTKYILVK